MENDYISDVEKLFLSIIKSSGFNGDFDISRSVDGESIFIDIYGDVYSGRVTVWSNGPSDVSVIKNSGDQILYKQAEFARFPSKIEEFLRIILASTQGR